MNEHEFVVPEIDYEDVRVDKDIFTINAPHTRELDGELKPRFNGAPFKPRPMEAFDTVINQYSVTNYIPEADLEKSGVTVYRESIPRVNLAEADQEEYAEDIIEKMKESIRRNLTEKQKQVLYIIRKFQYDRLYSPSAGEVAKILGGTSSTAVWKHIDALRKAGLIEMSTHEKNPLRNVIKFPREISFPWKDKTQFPETVFRPEHFHPLDPH